MLEDFTNALSLSNKFSSGGFNQDESQCSLGMHDNFISIDEASKKEIKSPFGQTNYINDSSEEHSNDDVVTEPLSGLQKPIMTVSQINKGYK